MMMMMMMMLMMMMMMMSSNEATDTVGVLKIRINSNKTLLRWCSCTVAGFAGSSWTLLKSPLKT